MLAGENGSGKTTLVKLLAGLYTPQPGRILGGGVDGRRPIARRSSPKSPQSTRTSTAGRPRQGPTSPWAVPRQNRPSGASGRPRCTAARPCPSTGCPPRVDTLLVRGFRGGQQVSGGVCQKIGIARARCREAQLLIVDEPTAALDARAELRVFDQIRRLVDRGQTVVLIARRLASYAWTTWCTSSPREASTDGCTTSGPPGSRARRSSQRRRPRR
ncbi:ATP-binding cassette domain-containing protein [Streptomyces xiaopingdaonensis]|uniref:ATP-binding cassette domain-containing protein n=1 Tax=Streptomyces xiaopingdaonensis TaxID=1565415 RepID=UPI003B4392F3